jgi:hypothetical protein
MNGNQASLSSETSCGVNVSYAYGVLNWLTGVLSNGTSVATYGFDGVGNLQSLQYGNGCDHFQPCRHLT